MLFEWKYVCRNIFYNWQHCVSSLLSLSSHGWKSHIFNRINHFNSNSRCKMYNIIYSPKKAYIIKYIKSSMKKSNSKHRKGRIVKRFYWNFHHKCVISLLVFILKILACIAWLQTYKKLCLNLSFIDDVKWVIFLSLAFYCANILLQ